MRVFYTESNPVLKEFKQMEKDLIAVYVKDMKAAVNKLRAQCTAITPIASNKFDAFDRIFKSILTDIKSVDEIQEKGDALFKDLLFFLWARKY